MAKQLPHYWTYKTNLPEPPALELHERRPYLYNLFEKAYNDGYEQAQSDMREVLGIAEQEKSNG